MIDKKQLSERDICTKFITPAIGRAGWDITSQVREEISFTDGKIYVRGSLTMRGKRKRADYILYHRPNIPVAIIEAKDNKHSVGAGMQQALEYARILDIPCVFSSNGDGFAFKVIVLDSNIQSMTEFKQIIGRGTRINEEYGKRYFTIIDFRNVTGLFADPDSNGDPVRIKVSAEDDDLTCIETEEEESGTPIVDEETGEEFIIDAGRPTTGKKRNEKKPSSGNSKNMVFWPRNCKKLSTVNWTSLTSFAMSPLISRR